MSGLSPICRRRSLRLVLRSYPGLFTACPAAPFIGLVTLVRVFRRAIIFQRRRSVEPLCSGGRCQIAPCPPPTGSASPKVGTSFCGASGATKCPAGVCVCSGVAARDENSELEFKYGGRTRDRSVKHVCLGFCVPRCLPFVACEKVCCLLLERRGVRVLCGVRQSNSGLFVVVGWRAQHTQSLNLSRSPHGLRNDL